MINLLQLHIRGNEKIYIMDGVQVPFSWIVGKHVNRMVIVFQ